MRRPNRSATGRPKPAFWILLPLCLAIAAPPPAAAQERLRPKDLPPKYQDWIKLTSYIIRDNELDVFLTLTNDRDRDIFIEAFWRIRDPTPGTPQNEYKEEHLKRFQEANRKFRYGSAREGWMTDRGRIYIILGPPLSTQYFAGGTDTYPAEIWSYYGDVSKGMPTHFELVFFQWRNAGEMKLYDPVADGPGRLIIDTAESERLMASDYEAMYDRIFQVHPDLARVCLSIIPGEIPYGFQPSIDTPIFMAAIYDSPKKGLNDSYATHFRNYKGIVSTEYLTNYIDCASSVGVFYDLATGTYFCDFALVPERLSVDYYEPRSEYYCNFQIDVNLRDGDDIIFQYSKEYPLSFNEQQLREAEGMGVCLADSFPAIPGKYLLTVLLRNTIGKEFSILERNVEIPSSSGPPRITGPTLGVRMGDIRAGVHLPFQTGTKKINVDPKSTYAATDDIAFLFNVVGLTRDLWNGGSLEIAVNGSAGTAPFEKSYTIPLSEHPFRQIMAFSQEIRAGEVPPGYYDLVLSLKDGQGNVLHDQKGNFIISPISVMSHPLVASRAFDMTNSFMFQYMLAEQYERAGKFDLAAAAYRKAYELNPSYTQKIPDYASFQLKRGSAEEALALVETIADDSGLAFQYHFLKGRALLALNRNDEALLSLQEGNKIYNSDAGLLAALGTCYHRLGEKERALAALKASLSLNPEQAEVKALIAEIEKKTTD
jgi:GWxTD domain-containing protein